MAIPEWELNLFGADPDLLRPHADADYERAAATVAALASTTRLLLLHALAVGERTPLRAAAWAGVSQARAQAELLDLERRGMVAQEAGDEGIEYRPADGHLVALLFTALAHGARRHGTDPLLLRGKRRVAARARRTGQ